MLPVQEDQDPGDTVVVVAMETMHILTATMNKLHEYNQMFLLKERQFLHSFAMNGCTFYGKHIPE